MKYFFKGVLIGLAVVFICSGALWALIHWIQIEPTDPPVERVVASREQPSHKEFVETFSKPLKIKNQMRFGDDDQFTFELHREGTFLIEGDGIAWQTSDSYLDSAYIRSTHPLPKTYKVTVIAGDIDYDLFKIAHLANDPNYPEGPKNENGVYLLSITDELPTAPHINVWWHKHRKLVIDVDNNIWGQGMPNPIFMVYFDRKNKLKAYQGEINSWQDEWEDALKYEEGKFYKIEVEKTNKEFILRVSEEQGKLLKEARVALHKVWHGTQDTEEYFVIGEPHENYYMGRMKIKEIRLTYL